MPPHERTGKDHQGVHISCAWTPSSEIWQPTTSHWTKQSIWLRTAICEGWCLRMVVRTPSGACQKRRRTPSWYHTIVTKHWREFSNQLTSNYDHEMQLFGDWHQTRYITLCCRLCAYNSPCPGVHQELLTFADSSNHGGIPPHISLDNVQTQNPDRWPHTAWDIFYVHEQ